jgi:septum formation protein
MLDNLKGYNLILASNSPRRRELLQQLGLEFTVKTVEGCDESYPDNLSGRDIALHISGSKALAFKPNLNHGDIVITADTIVYKDGIVFGKPKDRAEAISMLKTLSGSVHKVFTGVCISGDHYQSEFCAATDVCFAILKDEDIEWYVDNCQPFDKAGSYGIQEWIGFIGVEWISGSFFNVMGLPVHMLFEELKKVPPINII